MNKQIQTSTFTKFNNIHHNNPAIIFGTGPTLLDYNTETPLHQDSIKVGVNSIIFHDTPLDLDYYFIQDQGITEAHPNSYYKSKTQYDRYRVNIQKFYGTSSHKTNKNWYLSLDDCRDGHALPYLVNVRSDYAYTSNLDTEPVGDGHTVVMSAIQFLLYTGVKKIYLVGIDCTGARIKETKSKVYNLKGWYKMKQWIDTLHDVSIININPVGLIDIFDKY